MANSPYFVPALHLLPYWPHDLVTPDDIPVFGTLQHYIGISDFKIFDYDGYLTLAGVMAVFGELAFDLPLVDGLSLVLGKAGGGVTQMPFEMRFGQPVEAEEVTSAEGAFTLFLAGYVPPYELILPEFDIKLRVSRDHLKPMTPKDSANPETGFEDGPEDKHVEFVLRGELVINTETGVHVEGFSAVDLDYAQIGSTGVVIKAEDVVIRLSSAQPMPDIEDPDFDLPDDWKGLYFAELSAYNLQKVWDVLPPKLELTNWYLGNGGVTGKMATVFELQPDMSSRTFALRTLQIAFQQNTLVQSLVQVAVKLSFWDDRVLYIDAAVTNDPLLDSPASLGIQGSVAAEQPPDVPLPVADELFPLALSSGTTVIAQLRVTKFGIRSGPDRERAKKLEIDEETRFLDFLVDGHFSVLPASSVGEGPFGAGATGIGMHVSPEFGFIMPGGAWVNVSEKVVSKLSGLPISFSRVGFGAENDEKWIGLDARLAFGSGTTFGAAVKGLRIYFGGAAGLHLAFDGIELSLSSLPAFSIAGLISMTSEPDPGGMAGGDNVTFQGSAEILIGAIGLKMGGFLLFGRKDGDRFWYSAIEGTFEPGLPIPLVGFALLGGTLLYGRDVTPTRQLSGDQGDNFNWYEHWYKPAPGPFQVIHGGKWRPARDQNAYGIGATFGNIPSGRNWSLKSLLVILTPGPVLIFEGRLKLFSPPEEHKGPPKSNVRALAVWTPDESSFLLSFEIDYKLPGSGVLVDLHAEGEIFYRGGWPPDDWYVAIGWYEPISRRIHASLLRMFDSDAYVIASGRELTIAERTLPAIAFAFGFRTGFDKRFTLGPVRAVIAAWFSVDLAFCIKPKYVLGLVELHGELALKVYGFGFELLLDARMSLEAPVNDDDLLFTGEIEIKVGLPWPLPDIKKQKTITFGDTSGLPPPVDPLVESASAMPGYPAPGDPIFRLDETIDSVASLPMDGRVTINFQRPMRSTWSGAPTPVSVATPDQVGNVFYRYTVTDVRVQVEQSNGALSDLTEDLFGQWALGVGDRSGPNADSLILWGLTPFPYTGALGWPTRTVRRSWADLLMRYHDDYPCGDDLPPERCVDFNLVSPGVYDPELRYQPDPTLSPLHFTPSPAGELLQPLLAKWSEMVRVPLQAVEDSPDHCLHLARTTFIGRKDSSSTTLVRQSLVLWGVAIDLPASVRANGFLDYSLAHLRLRLRVLRDDVVLRDEFLDTQEFEVIVDAPETFNRLELLLEPVHQLPAPAVGPPPCLRRFCYTSVGLADSLAEVALIRDHWLHVFDSVTETNGGPGETPGEALIHEPDTTYHIEIDILTESAESVDGPWTDRGTKTEIFSVPVGGAPADLSPYIERVVPSDGERPVYADYDLRVTYNRFYVETMYRKSGEPLRARLLDLMGNEVEPVAEPASRPEPGLTDELALYADLLANADCVPFDTTLVPGNDETRYVTRLATSTSYEIQLFGGGHDEPVHRWNFSTSRYRDFAAHIADLRPSPWDEGLPAGADIAALEARLAAVAGVDRDEEFDLFLAAWTQDLALPLRTLPEKPEASLHWDVSGAGAAVRALSFASPEPLLGARTVLRLLRREDGGTTSELPFALLRSRDGNRALLAPLDSAGVATELPAGDYLVEFTYRLSGPGLSEISRGGDLSDETASWPFSLLDEPARLIDPEA